MKKSFLTLTAAVFLVGAIFSGCKPSTNRVEDAEQSLDEAKVDLEDARIELTEARKEYYEDYLVFKKEYDAKILQNELAIADLKTMIALSSDQSRPALERELATLEKKNNELKKSLENYNESGKDKWESFKSEFKSSMNDLGQAIGKLMSGKQ